MNIATNLGQIGTNSTMIQAKKLEHADRMATNVIKNKDEDGNGTLNAAEFARNEDKFNRIDLNADGELDKVELSSAFANKGKHVLHKRVSNLIEHKDEDGNGSLNVSEFGHDEEMFNRIDSNADGELGRDELSKLLGRVDISA